MRNLGTPVFPRALFDAVLDAWILAGRKRFGSPRLFGRDDGLKPVVQALRAGQAYADLVAAGKDVALWPDHLRQQMYTGIRS